MNVDPNCGSVVSGLAVAAPGARPGAAAVGAADAGGAGAVLGGEGACSLRCVAAANASSHLTSLALYLQVSSTGATYEATPDNPFLPDMPIITPMIV